MLALIGIRTHSSDVPDGTMKQSWFTFMGGFLLAVLGVFAGLMGIVFGWGDLGRHLLAYPLDLLAVVCVLGAASGFVLAGRVAEVRIGARTVTWRHLVAATCALIGVAMVVPYLPALLDDPPEIVVLGFISGGAIAVAMALVAVGVLYDLLGVQPDVDATIDWSG